MAEKIEIKFREGEDEVTDEDLGHIEETSNGGVQVNPEKEERGGGEGGDADRPEWLDPKFKTPEEMAKAYRELQRKLSGGKEETPTPESDSLRLGSEKPAAEKPEANTPADLKLGGDQKETPEAPKVDFDEVAQEYTREGKLSEETFQALEKAGYNRQTTERYLRGVQAEAAQVRSRLAEVVGGEEALPEVLAWARTNLTEGEKAFFDQAVSSGNEDSARMAMRAIHSQYVAQNGQAPKLLNTENRATNGGVQPYESMDDYVAAIQDPRYDTSPKYRKMVEERLRVTDM